MEHARGLQFGVCGIPMVEIWRSPWAGFEVANNVMGRHKREMFPWGPHGQGLGFPVEVLGGWAMGHFVVRGPLTQTLTWNCTASGLLGVAPES